MTKWEYLWCAQVQDLNTFGLLGWELVSVVVDRETPEGFAAIYKRPLPDPDKPSRPSCSGS